MIRSTLKEIMMSVDLDEVTSKYIRGRLEEDLDMDLGEFKPFIDQEMLTILGQMDAPTEIFDHVYLGSEWNASNLEELQKNGYVRSRARGEGVFPHVSLCAVMRIFIVVLNPVTRSSSDTLSIYSFAR